MAVKVISYGLLELMIRRPFLEPLIEEMSQVLVQLPSCRKYIKQTEHINNRASQRLSSLRAECRKATGNHSSQPPSVIRRTYFRFSSAGEKATKYVIKIKQH